MFVQVVNRVTLQKFDVANKLKICLRETTQK